MRQISGEESEIIGASRTDSGAHARGQSCHFDCGVNLPVEKWAQVLNRQLPNDIVIVRARNVPDHFNARFSARWRTYRYQIAEAKDAFQLRTAHWEPRALNLAEVQKAAEYLVGEHDFRWFSEQCQDVENTVRILRYVKVSRHGNNVWIDIRGNAFVRGMMRRIAGGLLEVGLKRRPPEDIRRLLHLKHREDMTPPVVLPAHGLTLLRVSYHPQFKDLRESVDLEKQNRSIQESDE